MLDIETPPRSHFYREYDLTQARVGASPRAPAAHQQAALTKLEGWYRSSSVEPRGAILVLPTGGGKTFTAVRFACGPIADGYKVLWLAHTHHLLEQALTGFNDSVGSINEPKLMLGVRVMSGATGHFQVHGIRPSDDVVIASLQAVAKAAHHEHEALGAFLKAAGGKLLVVFDEAHHAPAPSYRKLMQQLRESCPGMMLLGLTATPTYEEEKKRGWLRVLFPQGIIHQESAQKLMAAGILAKPMFEEARTSIEAAFSDREYTKWIGTNRDIPEEMISYLATNRSRNEYIAAYYLKNRNKFGKTLIFADRWAQCEAICTLLKERGVRADAVYSHVTLFYGTPEERNRRTSTENGQILKKFRDGELDVLVNVKMLTEGTDVPDVNTVFLTRQTTSRILMTQMVGRALRGSAFGGTDNAYIVSFVDDWKQRINWAEYAQIADGLADESDPESRKRPPVHLISIDLVRRLARQMDSGINYNPLPFHSFLPLGWYCVEFDAQVGDTEDIEPVRQLLLAYEADKPQFDNFIEAMKGEDLREFEENSVRLEAVRPRLESWEAEYFTAAEQRVGMALVNDMLSIVRHMAQNEGAVPPFFSFDSRSDHDLDSVATQFLTEGIGYLAADQSLRREFVRPDRLWRVFYPRYEQFKSSLDACMNRCMQIGFKAEPIDGSATIYTPTEPIPDREPSDAVKEQVKSRDGYRCLCCGSRPRRLQVDHVAPSYMGGRNHLENLQALCQICNQAKGIDTMIFRTNQTSLSAASSRLPALMFPSGDHTKEAEIWEQFLRRWVNFFYRCSATERVEVGEKADRLRVWKIRLFPENNPEWLVPHLDELVRQIREARTVAGFLAAPDRIALNEQPVMLPPKAAEDQSKLTTLEEVLLEIEKVERFRLRILNSAGRKIRGDWTRGIIRYPYSKALDGDVTVDRWKQSRFLFHYPVFDDAEFQVEIIDGSDYRCAGQTKLRTVRESHAR